MIGKRRYAFLAETAVISTLAASVWFAAPLTRAAGEEPEPPIALEGSSSAESRDQTLEIPAADATDPFGAEELGNITEYKNEQSVETLQLTLGGGYLQDGSGFDFESRATRILGITGSDEISRFEGRWADGVMIVKVLANSPAAPAGLKGRRAGLQYLLEGVAVAGSIVFPPAFMVVPLVQEAEIGKSYDLIIGVDGERIRDVMDLDDSLQKVEPGEIVYLSTIRPRHRVQIPVTVPNERLQQH